MRTFAVHPRAKRRLVGVGVVLVSTDEDIGGAIVLDTNTLVISSTGWKRMRATREPEVTINNGRKSGVQQPNRSC
jgi:hypothetical protein